MQTAILEPAPETANLEAMPRADGLAIWGEIRERAEKLKLTAETLTVTSADDKAGMALARTTRLALRDVRLLARDRHKEMKEEYLVKGRKVDAAKNEIFSLIEPLEARLLEQEQFAERQEAARIAELAGVRTAELINAESFIPSNVGAMPEDDYLALLEGAKLTKAAKIEAARKLEEERVANEKAEAEERERIRQENIRLKTEAEAREAEARKEREAAAAKQREIEANAAKERAAAAEALSKEREAREAVERQQRETVAAEQRRAAADAKAKAEREKAEQEAACKAATAPDKEKLRDFAATVRALSAPTLSASAAATGEEVARKVINFANWIETQADAL